MYLVIVFRKLLSSTISIYSIRMNVPTQFRHAFRHQFFTKAFCCHGLSFFLHLELRDPLNFHVHLFRLASFAHEKALLHCAVIIDGKLSLPQSFRKKD